MSNTCLGLIATLAALLGRNIGAQSPETRLYREVAPSIVRIEAGVASGSGFIVGDSTIVATNAHVIAEADTITVYVRPTRRVPARVLARDDARDLAILQIPTEGCEGCRPLPLADDSVVVVGLPVVVVGYPLGQPLTMTRGIVATLRPGVLLTDAAINAGNSGGPLLSPSGSVVGMATFSDPDPRGVSAGLGGAVLVKRLRSLLMTVRATMRPWYDSTSLPVLPVDEYSPSLLAAIADTASTMYYDRLSGVNVGPFTVRVSTPLSQYVLRVELGRQVSSDRRKRESAADLAVQDRYNELASVRDWSAVVSDEDMPVVSISVEPNASETIGSVLVRAVAEAVAGSSTAATFKFRGDVRGAILRRNGEVVPALRGGHAPMTVNIDNEWISFRDVADMGSYVYSPIAFRPNPDGSVPALELEVRDLKAPDKVRKQKLNDVVVARVWNDFASYYQARNESFAAFSITRKCSAENRGMGATETVCEDVVGPAK